MPRKSELMVQCLFTKKAQAGEVFTTAWVEKRPDLAVGKRVSFKDAKDPNEFWTVKSMGAEKSVDDVNALQEAQRTLEDKLSTHA